jgi:muramoyltetrapeptide carboxypeptidase
MIPNKLIKGDKIGVIAPSSPITEDKLEDINNSIALMEASGFEIVFGKNAFKDTLGYGATAKEKAEDINYMFSNPEIKAIFCATGGANSNSTFEYLNYELIKNNPKILCI